MSPKLRSVVTGVVISASLGRTHSLSEEASILERAEMEPNPRIGCPVN